MWLKCPYCRSSMEVTNIAPGHYRPRCRSCKELFYIGVPADDAAEDVVVKTLQEIRQEMRASLGIPSKPHRATNSTAVNASTTLPIATRLEEDEEISPSYASNGEALQTFAGDEYSLPYVDQEHEEADDEDEPLLSRPNFDLSEAPADFASERAAQHDFSETLPQRSTAHDGVAATLATAAILPEDVDATRSTAGEAMPDTLAGYRLIRILGQGAMGAVYLARQKSLDREVAVKTIQAKWAANPVFISRFIREAYAAAQLTHHNIVQIYDMGEDAGVHFFSMELVNGQSLGDLLKETGKLDRDIAVGYILQAARGLQFAHQRGLIHRDVKPDNLMVNAQGVVKVADLGLVKLPDVDEQSSRGVDQELLKRRSASTTIANLSMGTPAYMPPEQARDAASVDHRADIYSLGCTFYALLTGRPPFEGTTALEVITKHLEQPIVRPDAVAKHVPKQLADITMRMVAKDPDQRASSLAEVIKKLEEYLGMGPTGTFSPGQQHVDMLESAVTQFNSAAAGPLRKSCCLAVAGMLVAAMIGGVLFGLGGVFVAAVSMAAATPIAYLAISGSLSGNFLYRKLREFLFSSSLIDWLKYLGGAMLIVLLLAATGSLVAAMGGIVLAIAVAAAYYFMVDRTLHKQHQSAMEKIAQLLKALRLRGLDESEVRSFLVKYAGADWEEVFEELFGYQAKMHARDFLSRTGGPEKNRTFAAWRDPIIRYCDRRISAAKEIRERRHLASIEAKRLQAEGATAEEAEAAADRAAQAIINDAIHQRETAIDPDQAVSLDPLKAAAQRRSRMQQLLREARTAQPSVPISVKNLLAAPLAFLTGSPLRIIVGAALITGCVMWLQQNHLLSGKLAAAALDTERTYQPLDVPLVTVAIADYVSTFSAGVAGLILLGSACFGGWRLSLFTWPAAFVILYGAALGIPDVSEKLHAGFLAGVVGVTIFAVGMILFGDDVEE